MLIFNWPVCPNSDKNSESCDVIGFPAYLHRMWWLRPYVANALVRGRDRKGEFDGYPHVRHVACRAEKIEENRPK